MHHGADKTDHGHRVRCAALLTEATEDLVVPLLVLAEVDHWCAERLPHHAWLTFMDDVLAGVYRPEPPTTVDLARARELQEAYRDRALGVVDATVIALAERLREPRVATLDHRHFATVRPAHVPGFLLVP